MGLRQAGFDVVGVDHEPQPNYPFDFVQADVLELPFALTGFDLVWASPPCQRWSSISRVSSTGDHPDLLTPTREMLREAGVEYVIENVPGAPLEFPVRLCGSMFGLGCKGAQLRRHRYFECSFLVLTPECRHHMPKTIGVYGDSPNDASADYRRRLTIGVYGHGPHNEYRNAYRRRNGTITVTGNTPQQNVVRNKVRRTFSIEEAQEAMGIDWMPMRELSQAVPPAYSRFLAEAFLTGRDG